MAYSSMNSRREKNAVCKFPIMKPFTLTAQEGKYDEFPYTYLNLTRSQKQRDKALTLVHAQTILYTSN